MSASDAAPVALEARSVAKLFHAGGREVQALRDVSFRVRHAVVSGLVGPDGAGKTTLMRLAAGLLVPASGSITVLGMDASRDSLRVQSVLGYMPQRFGLYEDLSVRQNLDLYADLQGVPHRERKDRYAELMRMTGLARFSDRLAGRLSGGMKQKLGLACTLVRAPRLLLLDEPTVGVDPVSRRELWTIVYRLVRDEGMSVLLSTAYLDEAERCDEVVLLHEGGVLAAGAPATLTTRMQGRAFALTAPGASKRDVLAQATALPGVIDGVIQAEHVRLVTEQAQTPDIGALLQSFPSARIEPVPPRFEDGFVALLRPTRTTAQSLSTAGTPAAMDSATGEVMIEVHDVKRRFGDFYAVNGVSFDVHRGEVFGLLGPNGAGKSTTFRMLCGLLPASAGTLRVAGVDLRRAAAAARAHIGYMSQKFSLYGNLSVRQNLDFFARVYGLSANRRSERIDWALAEFELASYAESTSADLPLGYKQRLALACALMHEPDLLFLDEPTSGVDPLARREFWGRINALARARVTVLVTTHFMEEAEYCDRLAILAAGQLLAVGAPGEIKASQEATGAETTMEDAFVHLIQAFERRGDQS